MTIIWAHNPVYIIHRAWTLDFVKRFHAVRDVIAQVQMVLTDV